jgi:hypothetical protein
MDGKKAEKGTSNPVGHCLGEVLLFLSGKRRHSEDL